MIELLIESGADIDAQNESGKTALMLAAFSGKLKIIQELRSNGASYDKYDRSGSYVIHYAVDGGNVDSLQWMLLDGIDPNKRDMNSGWTPLFRVANISGNKDVAELLIKFKADVNAKDKENKTPLMMAIINGNQPLVELLVDHGNSLM
jgi:ankyrin repeat protein